MRKIGLVEILIIMIALFSGVFCLMNPTRISEVAPYCVGSIALVLFFID